MYQRLSHTLRVGDRGFPDAPTMRIEPFESMKKGEQLNTYNVTLFDHFGTHMDGPFHFNENGIMLFEEDLSTFISESPLLVDIPKGKGEFVEPEDLKPFEKQIETADMLFIRSGFECLRQKDNRAYANEGPAVSSRAAQWLTQGFPNLKAIGMDWISLTSPLHAEDGVKAHQIMLGKFGAKPILIIEDIALQDVQAERLKRVFVMPLFIEGIDSAPVTILAELQ